MRTLVLILLLSLACPAEDLRKTMTFGGMERSYYVHLPPSAQGKPLPLLILLHGGGGGAAQALENYPLAPLADREGFILAAPNGTGPLPREVLRTWNVGWGFGYAQRKKVDDVGFIRALIGQLKKDYQVDPKRVYLTGLSNGAILCHYAGAANSDLLAGIAPVVGCAGGGESPELSYPPTPTHPLNVILFNGELDRHVPLKGGKQELHTEKQARYVCSAQQSAEFWVKANGCQSKPKIEELPKQKATRYTWSGGKQNTRVVLWVLHNQGHAWPGGGAPRSASDLPSNLVKAHEELWQFFFLAGTRWPPRMTSPPIIAGPPLGASGKGVALGVPAGMVAPWGAGLRLGVPTSAGATVPLGCWASREAERPQARHKLKTTLERSDFVIHSSQFSSESSSEFTRAGSGFHTPMAVSG